MSDAMLSTWGVVLDVDVLSIVDEPMAAGRCFALGRSNYFELCPGLAEFLRVNGAALRVATENLEAIPLVPGGSWRVGVSVIEVRPSSFDMAVRIHALGETTLEPVNGRCTVVIERIATGERLAIPRDVQDEFISIQLSARGLA
jgi:hypothetical protein